MSTTKPLVNAMTVQYIMIILILLMISGIIGIFVLANNLLSVKSVATDHARIDAELAQEEIVRLQQLRTVLSENKAIVDKTAKIVADSQQYEFQNQVIYDITAYAKQNNIDILGFDFGVKPGTAPSASENTGVGKNQQKTIVTLQLNNNIRYDAFLRFLKSIENNITKMQLTGISLSPNTTDPTLILGPTIEIEVFLR